MTTKPYPERRDGNGYSFFADGKWFMVRCHECERENYPLAVAAGVCYFCGFDANKKFSEEVKE